MAERSFSVIGGTYDPEESGIETWGAVSGGGGGGIDEGVPGVGVPVEDEGVGADCLFLSARGPVGTFWYPSLWVFAPLGGRCSLSLPNYLLQLDYSLSK